MKRFLTLTAAAACLAAPAAADEFSDAIESFYNSEIVGWANAQVLIDAINAQNTVTGGYDLAQIEALDQTWRAEVGQPNTPTISPVLENAAAGFLREQVAAYGGQITEIFIMDAQGLNVAASDVTSDYWQGDEAKHSETYANGAEGFHISDIELDESTQRYQGQVSFTLVDPTSGAPIGAMTVGIDADSLM